ncbi:hypothetical protein [Rhodococcoides kroppenstedtii]|uniref:hypothetical protein n=1 Tax=Rhodococcoides kroppenstedtii TaxID=293050 RepID=UPI001427CC8A|nr:hypothetical protein [Rhodococcus kroppenstedtii]NIL81387.1 hypothetical protein [Rhodococcus kroppenstedtii]
MAEQPGRVERAVSSVLDNASRLQAPAVEKYVWRLRRAHPEESPQQIVTRLEKLFLGAVTSSGGAAGATAAIPGVGTVASIAAVGGETAFFLEAAALLTLAVASVHGISVTDHDRRKALVLAVALGDSGKEIVQRSLGRTGNVGKMLSAGIPGGANLSGLNKRLITKFVQKFAARRGAVMLGTMLPAGIGAAVGGAGNRALGKTVITNAREAFGPPPAAWPDASAPPVEPPR